MLNKTPKTITISKSTLTEIIAKETEMVSKEKDKRWSTTFTEYGQRIVFSTPFTANGHSYEKLLVDVIEKQKNNKVKGAEAFAYDKDGNEYEVNFDFNPNKTLQRHLDSRIYEFPFPGPKA